MPIYKWCRQKNGTFAKCSEAELNQRLEEMSRLGLHIAFFIVIFGIVITALYFLLH